MYGAFRFLIFFSVACIGCTSVRKDSNARLQKQSYALNASRDINFENLYLKDISLLRATRSINDEMSSMGVDMSIKFDLRGEWDFSRNPAADLDALMNVKLNIEYESTTLEMLCFEIANECNLRCVFRNDSVIFIPNRYFLLNSLYENSFPPVEDYSTCVDGPLFSEVFLALKIRIDASSHLGFRLLADSQLGEEIMKRRVTMPPIENMTIVDALKLLAMQTSMDFYLEGNVILLVPSPNERTKEEGR